MWPAFRHGSSWCIAPTREHARGPSSTPSARLPDRRFRAVGCRARGADPGTPAGPARVAPRHVPIPRLRAGLRAEHGCFNRVLQPALLGLERSPWLLALGDVVFHHPGPLRLGHGARRGLLAAVHGPTADDGRAVFLPSSWERPRRRRTRSAPTGRSSATRCTPPPIPWCSRRSGHWWARRWPEELLFRGYLMGSSIAGAPVGARGAARPGVRGGARRAFFTGTGLGG